MILFSTQKTLNINKIKKNFLFVFQQLINKKFIIIIIFNYYKDKKKNKIKPSLEKNLKIIKLINKILKLMTLEQNFIKNKKKIKDNN